MKYAQELYCSHAGLRDNPAIEPEEIAAIERALEYDPGQLKARVEGAFTTPAGLALKSFDPNRNYETLSRGDVLELVRRGRSFGGIDFGAWRFAFLLCVADRAGRAHVVEEYFSQREQLEDRAKRIDAILRGLAVPFKTPIWGDLANLQDIIELNAAFHRLQSKYRVIPVAADNKIRTASVDRLNNLFSRAALLIRRGLGQPLDGAKPQVWRLGMDASHEGSPVVGSRLAWEIGAWSYPEPKEGKAQKQDPDDDSADGADAIAALRYAIMSWWTAAKKIWPEWEGAWDKRALKAEYEQGRRIDTKRDLTRVRRAPRRGLHPEFGEVF